MSRNIGRVKLNATRSYDAVIVVESSACGGWEEAGMALRNHVRLYWD